MYRNIVALLEDKVANSNLLDTATNLAKSSDGHITGIYVLPLTPTMFSMPDVVDVEALRKKVNKVHEKFESAINTVSVKGKWHYTEGGDVVAEVARLGLYADLILLNQDDSRHSITDKILLTASCPMLLLPPSSRLNGIFDHVLVAWKGTREAARALHDSLPLLHKASKVTIAIFGDISIDEKQALESYLEVHGINAKIDQKPLEISSAKHDLHDDIEKSVGRRLLALSKENESDLLVMGAFGHSRLSEAVLSGVTRLVSRNAEIPVLMSH